MAGQLPLVAPGIGRSRLPTGARVSKFMRQHWVPYAYIAPFFLLYAAFGAFPVLYSLWLSFHEWNGIDQTAFVGLDNYLRLFQDRKFFQALYNTVWIGIVAHVPMLSIALVVAFLINSHLVRWKDFWRTAYFMPVVTSGVAMAIVWGTLFGFRFGLLNYALSWFGISRINWLEGAGDWVRPAIAIMMNWRWIGWNMVIYLAGLQSIPVELFEAARVDGATQPQTFRHVVVPLLKPVILVTLIFSTIGTMTLFDEPYILVGPAGGPGNQGMTLALYLYRQGFQFVHFGYAAAIAYVIFALIFVISYLNIRFFRADAETEVRRP